MPSLFAFWGRNQELKDLGELAPHWDNMRRSVIAHCDQMLSMYQDTLAELGKHTGRNWDFICNISELARLLACKILASSTGIKYIKILESKDGLDWKGA